jgi:hypothetical protein
MRIAVPQTAKLYPFDRNPATKIFIAEQANTGPLARTMVWSYTVPTGRVFMLSVVLLSQLVVSPGNFASYGFIDIDIDFMMVFTNYVVADAMGNNRWSNISVQVPLVSGKVLSSNWSINGNAIISQSLEAMGVEYDR